MKNEKSQRGKFNAWYLLLIIPFIITLFPGIYAFDAPRLFGFPFFYWYQLVAVLISAALTGIVYAATKEKE
jgi:hypothetical protein